MSFSSTLESKLNKKDDSTSWMWIGTGAAAVVGATYLAWRFLFKKPNATTTPPQTTPQKENLNSIENPAPETQELSVETTTQIFKEITNKMRLIIVRLAQIEQQLRASAMKTGKNLPEKDLHAYLMNQFQAAMATAEKEIYTKFKTTEPVVQACSKAYEEVPEFKAAVTEMTSLFNVFMGKPNTKEVPSDMTLELVMEIMAETMTKMTLCMEEVCAKLKEEGIEMGSEKFQRELQERYMRNSQEVRTTVHKKYNITQVSFKPARTRIKPRTQ